MAVHTRIDPAEAADRLAIRELFDAYAHCADRRDADGQKALFTVDTRFAVFMDGEGTEPTYVLEGRESSTARAPSILMVTVLPASPTRSLTTSSPTTASARS
jgi:hypothetical protein